MPFRRSLRDFRGFTLVELLVVIGIIAVLATILLLQLGTARSKSRDAARISHINQMRSAIEQFFDDCGSYPRDNNFTQGYALTGCGAGTKVIDKYISPTPVDPLGASTCTTYNGASGNGCYGYAWNVLAGTSATRYQIWAELELKNKQALDNDSDVNVGVDWTATGGSGTNGTTETCANSSTADHECQFDLGLK